MIEQRPQFCQRIIAVAIHHFAAQPFSGEAAGPTARGNIVEGLISKVIPQFNLRQGGSSSLSAVKSCNSRQRRLASDGQSHCRWLPT